MVVVNAKITLSIPDFCPECGGKLNHVNALDTKAKVYMIFCKNPKSCRFCREYKLCPNCGVLVCL